MTRTEAKDQVRKLGREEYQRRIKTGKNAKGYRVVAVISVDMTHAEAYLSWPTGGILPDQGGPLARVAITGAGT